MMRVSSIAGELPARTDGPPPGAPATAQTAGPPMASLCDAAIGERQRAIVGGAEKDEAGADVDAAAHAGAAFGAGAPIPPMAWF